MSWTVVNDNGVIQVRASLVTPVETVQLISALTKAMSVMAQQEKSNERPTGIRPLAASNGAAAEEKATEAGQEAEASETGVEARQAAEG